MMKRKLLAALLAALLLLSACQYIVVEDEGETQVGVGAPAHAETVAGPSDGPEAAPLARGSRDAADETAVAELQTRLIDLGYLSGAADGAFGGATEAALKAFQELNGLAVSGAADEATLSALNAPQALPMPTPTPTPLAKGAKGEDVRTVQERLKEYGFLSGSADGDFGANTDQALRDFQQYQYDLGLIRPTPAPEPAWEPDPAPAETPTPEEKAEPEAPAYTPDGVADDDTLETLLSGAFQTFREVLTRGSRGREVTRLQRRLADLDYHWDKVDGQFGPNTEDALKYFQKRNGLEESGAADEATQRRLFSGEAVKSDRPKTMYLLKVSVADQRVYAYRWANGKYSRLERTMVCSTGTKKNPTPLGTYKAGGPAGRWYYFKKYNCWAQYAYRITGPYLFHSVIYGSKDTGSLRQSSVNNLGSRASHGCVRLSVADVKWIYNNCPAGTTVTIY